MKYQKPWKDLPAWYWQVLTCCFYPLGPQKYVPILTRLYFLGFANLHLASFPMSIYEYSLELLDPPGKTQCNILLTKINFVKKCVHKNSNLNGREKYWDGSLFWKLFSPIARKKLFYWLRKNSCYILQICTKIMKKVILVLLLSLNWRLEDPIQDNRATQKSMSSSSLIWCMNMYYSWLFIDGTISEKFNTKLLKSWHTYVIITCF